MANLQNAYDVGDRLRLGNHSGNTATTAFKNSAGVDTDPTAITLRLEKPDGTATTYTHNGTPALTRETTGRYYVDVDLDQSGVWAAELKGTGAIVALDQWQFFVRSNLVG